MSIIGEAALSAFLDLLLGKLVSSALNFVADYKQVYQNLEEWRPKLQDIQAVLNDAEQKQISDEGVKKWLDDLQDLAYDVDDILDEFAYEALRLKSQNSEAQASTSKIRRLIPTCCKRSNFTPTSFAFNKNMIPKIEEITIRLNRLIERRDILVSSQILSRGATSNGKKLKLQLTSVIYEAVEYVGRDKEKQEMLEFLKSSNSDGQGGASVISIVGMGGMGKTTLAQLVYNDASLEKSFDLRAWVCVSDDFDAINITKSILKSIDPASGDVNDLNLLQVNLKERLSGKRFLLVMDDFWNESYDDWTILRSPFGARTKIIVTTRLQNVSCNVDAVKAFHLDKLSHIDCLSIFTQHALKARNFNGHPQFKEVGEKIVGRCNGLPLAAKAIGGMLSTIKDHGEWEEISESEIWELSEERCGIIPALRLSYHHLPSHLKRCFAYCSIFPKGYEFKEEEIILLWRAEGFLQQKTKSHKDLGSQSFRELASRSFFQISSNDKFHFVMHDLIHDLAQSVAGEICCKLEDGEPKKFSPRSRHSSYVCDWYDTVKKFEAFDQVKYLRTFLSLTMWVSSSGCYLTEVVLDKLLPTLSCLRVLSLCGYRITQLPDFFEKLKHLRYLNFSCTSIHCLPESLCTLYHLETLILKECRMLKKLPSKMENLVNLHYLDISGADSIIGMPSGFGKLINLERLSNFVIGEGNGHHIGELKNLSNLKDDFCLSGLENVNGQGAGQAKLNEKIRIDRLELQWSIDFENDRRNKEVEERVLDFLCPPKKLEHLIIESYGGVKFSVWISDPSFKKLLSLELRNCKNCKSLPSIGRLPLLKDLSISGLDEVNKIGVEFFGENQSSAFASLETLRFGSLSNWEEWDTCEGDKQVSKFPNLRELSITDCPQLLGRLPTHLRSLQKLLICRCTRLVVSISSFPSLRELSVHGCEELVDECSSTQEVTSLENVNLSEISKFSIPAERIKLKFANLELFSINGWKELASLSQNGFGLVGPRCIGISSCPQLVSLEAEEEKLQLEKIFGVELLIICDCERLNRLPKVLHAFTFLTAMSIIECPSFVSFADNNLPPALKMLMIRQCVNFQYLVDEIEKKSISSNTCLLENLDIQCCPSLICLSSRGDLYNQLRHLIVSDCSKLSCLFSDANLPITLKKLNILSCPELECIAQEFYGASCLESIWISECPKIKSLPRGLDKLSHLQEIRIKKWSSLVSFEESGLSSTNLRLFSIEDCENFGALPKCINNFTSLRELSVKNCSADISFPEEGFPTNLASLAISNAPKIYRSLVAGGLNRLTSLQVLSIGGEGCSNVLSFPEKGRGMMLPLSLSAITISKFKNLEFLFSQVFQDLTSLQGLFIGDCPKLTSLPEKDMLLSLEMLYISNCPLLKEECTRGKGREWSKIAHIPYVEIDEKSVIPRELN